MVVYGGVGCFNVFGGVKQLLKTGYSQCDVSVWDTSQVEGVEGHLGSRLTDGLGGYWADGLACWGQTLMEFASDFLNESNETFFTDFIGLANSFAGQKHSEMNSEQFQPVFLLKLSLSFEKLIFLTFLLHSSIFGEKLVILIQTIGGDTIVDEFLNTLENKMRVDNLSCFFSWDGFDFVDESGYGNRAVVFNFDWLAIVDEDLS